jgi:hypothetical protein
MSPAAIRIAAATLNGVVTKFRHQLQLILDVSGFYIKHVSHWQVTITITWSLLCWLTPKSFLYIKYVKKCIQFKLKCLWDWPSTVCQQFQCILSIPVLINFLSVVWVRSRQADRATDMTSPFSPIQPSINVYGGIKFLLLVNKRCWDTCSHLHRLRTNALYFVQVTWDMWLQWATRRWRRETADTCPARYYRKTSAIWQKQTSLLWVGAVDCTWVMCSDYLLLSVLDYCLLLRELAPPSLLFMIILPQLILHYSRWCGITANQMLYPCNICFVT